MAERAKAKKKTAAKKKAAARGKVKSKEPLGTIPASALKAKKGNKHNGPPAGGMSDEEKKSWQNKLSRARKDWDDKHEEAKSAKGVYDNVCKAAKKVGFAVDAWKDARELDKDDHGSVQQHYANVGDQLRVMNSNLATELNLFQDIDPRFAEGDDEAPAVKGLKCGRAGNSIDENPYTPGTEDYEAFRGNWFKGNDERLEQLKASGQLSH